MTPSDAMKSMFIAGVLSVIPSPYKPPKKIMIREAKRALDWFCDRYIIVESYKESHK
jgi:hypothetical protein